MGSGLSYCSWINIVCFFFQGIQICLQDSAMAVSRLQIRMPVSWKEAVFSPFVFN